MGDGGNRALRVQFDRRVKLEFHGANITSDGGLLLYRELDEALGLSAMAGDDLEDTRTGKNTQHVLMALLRQAVYGRLAGYEDTNDADRLRIDPAMRRIGGGRARERAAASTSLMSRFETEILTRDKNLQALTDLCGQWVAEANRRFRMKELIRDPDSSESPSHGRQEGSA